MVNGQLQRESLLEALQRDQFFDLLVIGGGATGCGIALDAASRGLSVALVDRNDFAEGTSSRSTKLIHGGVRYLEMAIRHLDRVQFNLVRDGLRERAIMLKNAPHLTRQIPLVTPLYKWGEVPYVYAGLKLYDLLAGKRGLGHSRLIGKGQVLERFPGICPEGLKAGVLYYDGQFLDSRMVLALMLTAIEYGVVAANHVGAVSFVKERGAVAGAVVEDRLTGTQWSIRARGVINATGPFVDQVRRLDQPDSEPILQTSSGIHLVLDKRFVPPETGLLIPKTEDGRVLFVLPWEGHALVGTTDEPAEVSEHPKPEMEAIDYLLHHLNKYFSLDVTRSDIKAAWSGLRPLVFDPKAADTARLARDHVITMSPSGLLTIAGGKWTTYRKMAQDTVDNAVLTYALSPRQKCSTQRLTLVGGTGFLPEGDQALLDQYQLDPEIAHHLNQAYGDRAGRVAALASKGYGERLAAGHPYLEAETIYAVRHELAVRAIDVLARRTMLAILDKKAVEIAAPRVIELMAQELGWNTEKQESELNLIKKRLLEGL